MLSSPRVISEHVNGILKGRWNWLNNIPCILNKDPKSMKKIMELKDVTVILHNFLIQEKLNSDEDLYYNPQENAGEDDDDTVLAPDEELNKPIAENDAGGKR